MKIKKLALILLAIPLLVSIPENVHAKTKRPTIIKISHRLVASSTYVTFTGKNALYSKAAPLKGAKVVRSKPQLIQYANSKRGLDSFMLLRTAILSNGNIYNKVRSFDNNITGWIYSGKTKSYQFGPFYFKDKKHTRPAGGLAEFRTLIKSPLTAAEKSNFYELAKPGTANDGYSKVYSIPFNVSPLGLGGPLINMPDKNSSEKYKNYIFVITDAVTNAREGDRWLSVASLGAKDNARISGYIRDGGLKKIDSVSPQDGITVNYVDYNSGKTLKTVIVPYRQTPGQTGMNLSTIYNYQQIPDGYEAGDMDHDFTSKIATNAAKGSTQTVYVVKK